MCKQTISGHTVSRESPKVKVALRRADILKGQLCVVVTREWAGDLRAAQEDHTWVLVQTKSGQGRNVAGGTPLQRMPLKMLVSTCPG